MLSRSASYALKPRLTRFNSLWQAHYGSPERCFNVAWTWLPAWNKGADGNLSCFLDLAKMMAQKASHLSTHEPQ